VLRPQDLILNSVAARECTVSDVGLAPELQGRIVAVLERRNKKCKTLQSAPAKFLMSATTRLFGNASK
jgi:hypothetical protein